MSFCFTPKQLEARAQIKLFPYMMFFGGSRSGKTFLAVRSVIVRALKSPGSRHAIMRFRFNAVKASIWYDTLPKVMKLCFPKVTFQENKTDWFIKFDNGAEIWFGGLDDKERTEKILGQEYCTIYLNECSQISWDAVLMTITRLAQCCVDVKDRPLVQRMFFDCNPPDKNHWTYRVFIQKVDPDSREPLGDAEDYSSVQMNPEDNKENLPEAYLKKLKNMPPHMRARFYEGNFKDANPNALFPEATLDKWRVESDDDLPQMSRIVVGVDPSGADDDNNEGNDAIGIYVAGLGYDGNAYLLEDATVKAGPNTWGTMAVSAYHRHQADILVGEKNFGGAMVKFVIQAKDNSVNFREVVASRGKVQRAEPFSPLFHDGRVRIVGRQIGLEEELSGFSTNGFIGDKSPNRADAAFWCLAELFPSIVNPRTEDKPVELQSGIVSYW